jgi:hypothetical protein
LVPRSQPGEEPSAPPTGGQGQAGVPGRPRSTPVPKTRQIKRWLLTCPDRLDPGDHAGLAVIKAHCPHVDALVGHIRSFAQTMTPPGLLANEGWLASVLASVKG